MNSSPSSRTVFRSRKSNHCYFVRRLGPRAYLRASIIRLMNVAVNPLKLRMARCVSSGSGASEISSRADQASDAKASNGARRVGVNASHPEGSSTCKQAPCSK